MVACSVKKYDVATNVIGLQSHMRSLLFREKCLDVVLSDVDIKVGDPSAGYDELCDQFSPYLADKAYTA